MERVVVIQVGILGTSWWQLSYQDELQLKYVEDIGNYICVVPGRPTTILDDLMIVLLVAFMGNDDVVDHQNKLQSLYELFVCMLDGTPGRRKRNDFYKI